MALFGAPKSTGKDALNAARCALRMIEERARLNRDGPRNIEIGIGIATGEAVAGCMGSSDRLNYTVLGERVNLASRLCSSAGRMEVVIDETTKSQLGDGSVLDPLPPLKLKGFSDAVPALKLKGLAPHS
jgi:class 3 adenylate cyclase